MIQGAGLLHRTVDATPVIGGIKGWTQQAAINSKLAREVVRMVIYGSMFMTALTLWKTFDLIQLGKVDATVGTLLGGIFAFFGGVLAVTIPAFMTALKTVGLNQPANTTNNGAITPPAAPNDPNAGK